MRPQLIPLPVHSDSVCIFLGPVGRLASGVFNAPFSLP